MRTMIQKVSSGKCDTCLFITGVVNSRCEIPIGGDRYLVRVERCGVRTIFGPNVERC